MIAFGSYIAYIVTLMCDAHDSTIFTTMSLHYVHLILSILLIVEVIVRACGYRKEYLAGSWNRFDVFVVIFTIAGTLNPKNYFHKKHLRFSSFHFLRRLYFHGSRCIFRFPFAAAIDKNFPF